MNAPAGRLARLRATYLGREVWTALGYLASGWVALPLLFTVAVTAVSVAASLAVTVLGVPLLLAAAFLLRGLATLERSRAELVVPRITPGYRSGARGLLARTGQVWRDPATWRDLATLVVLAPFLYALDVAAVLIWIAVAGLVTAPLWYWSIPQDFPDGSTAHGIALGWFPHGPDGAGAVGVFVGDLPTALGVAVLALILLWPVHRLVYGAARLHASIVAALLRAPADPMAAAHQVLASPGPLQPLT